MLKRALIAWSVFAAIGGLSAPGWAAEDLPLSVSGSAQRVADLVPPSTPVLNVNGNANLHPELFGALLIGGYMLYRARRHRVI